MHSKLRILFSLTFALLEMAPSHLSARTDSFGGMTEREWRAVSNDLNDDCSIQLTLIEATYSSYDSSILRGHGNKPPQPLAGWMNFNCKPDQFEISVLGEYLPSYGGELRSIGLLEVSDLEAPQRLEIQLQEYNETEFEKFQIVLQDNPQSHRVADLFKKTNQRFHLVRNVSKNLDFKAHGQMIDGSDEVLNMALRLDRSRMIGFLSLSFDFKSHAQNAIEVEPFTVENFARFFFLGSKIQNLSSKLNSKGLALLTSTELKDLNQQAFGLPSISGHEIEQKALALFGSWEAITAGPACTLLKTRHLPIILVQGQPQSGDLLGLRRVGGTKPATIYSAIKVSMSKQKGIWSAQPDQLLMRGWRDFQMMETQ